LSFHRRRNLALEPLLTEVSERRPLNYRPTYSYSLFFFPVLKNFRQQKRQHLVMMNITVATQARRNPITSREWYWNQERL
jgi:hypothetical protein